jgi:coenzyme F420-reducing hydrogenase alpha subunit
MEIKINHIAKMEGHAGFMASVVQGDVKSAKMEIKEGIRLIEGVLIGRKYYDVPIVAQRICGICPIVHNLASIKAVESAMGIEVSLETKKIRTLLEYAQIIHSHGLHLFFLSLADFLDIENDLKLLEKYPEEAKKAIKIREFGMDIVRTFGGRVVHILSNEAGGFKKVPSKEEIKKMIDKGEEAFHCVKDLGNIFSKLKIPEFYRETEFVALSKKGTYAIYDGDIVSSKGLHIPVEKFENNFHELHKQQEVVKRVEHEGHSYMVGAIARANINFKQISPSAFEYLESMNIKFPDFNPFHNILFQLAELFHFIEESRRLLNELFQVDLSKAITGHYEVKEGVGVGAVEAPRGTLYYHLDIDKKGYIKNANIITPTAQMINNLEDDIAVYIPKILNLSDKEKEKKLRAFIRAYDPCIACSVH